MQLIVTAVFFDVSVIRSWTHCEIGNYILLGAICVQRIVCVRDDKSMQTYEE